LWQVAPLRLPQLRNDAVTISFGYVRNWERPRVMLRCAISVQMGDRMLLQFMIAAILVLSCIAIIAMRRMEEDIIRRYQLDKMSGRAG
jgi:hypothetical protein